MVNYTAFTVSNLFVSRFKSIPEKWQMTVASLGYFVFYISGFLIEGKVKWFQYLVSAIAATINGFAASFLWASIGSYIHKVAVLHNSAPLKGKYYGIFCIGTNTCAVVGAVIVTFGLQYFTHASYFVFVASITLLAFFFGVFFITDLNKLAKKESLLNEETNEFE